jgi:hypothetical protein
MSRGTLRQSWKNTIAMLVWTTDFKTPTTDVVICRQKLNKILVFHPLNKLIESGIN